MCCAEKPLDGFHCSHGMSSGRQSHCKACAAQMRAQRVAAEKLRRAKRPPNAQEVFDGRKLCSVCRVLKSLGAFTRVPDKRSGFTSACNLCRNRRQRTALTHTKRKERNARETERRASDPAYRELVYQRTRRWKRENRPALMRERLKSDPTFRLNRNMSNQIRSGLKGNKAGRPWGGTVPYDLATLRAHLEAQFQPGMTWDNYGKGGWHVDHIIPKSVFNYTKPGDIDYIRCWALDNLQPLWEADNCSKGAKLEQPFQPALGLSLD